MNAGSVQQSAPAHIRKAASVISFANLTEEEKEVISRMERAQADYESIIASAREEALEQGKEEGIEIGAERSRSEHEDKTIEIAVRLVYESQFPVSKAIEFTGLGVDFKDRLTKILDERGIFYKI